MGKWIFAAVVLFVWFVVPALFGAMVKHDYKTASTGFRINQDADEYVPLEE